MAKKPTQEIVTIDQSTGTVVPEVEAPLRKNANLGVEMGKESPGDKSILGEILKSLQTNQVAAVERMSFETDPQRNISGAMGFYRLKQGLTPDHILKMITGPNGDELVSQILQARSNHLSAFGRPRTDRFSVGLEIQNMDKNAKLTEEEQERLQQRIDAVKKVLWKCGQGPINDELNHMSLPQFFKLIGRDGLAYGRLAVERLWWTNPKTNKREMYAFRASDAGTMYKILAQKETDQSLRMNAIRMLERLKNKKIDAERFKKDEYKYVQVIEGRPVQGFSEEEMVVYNLYPTTNVEYNGYPLTPIDQALNAINTHINITTHNKLYFQHGRAAKGMLVFKSDSVDDAAAQRIRLQFHQSINSVHNSWKMPVFGIQADDELSWQSIDISGRDAEFQYLMDNNARVILSAFQMSPEELPGYAHLARGTNTTALSESDNEYKLTAARDVGLRPFMHDIQDFLNTHILPFIDEELARTHQIVLAGLEKDSPEKENTRLQQDMAVHLTYNDIMKQVEKNPVPVELGGELPLNPQFQQVLDKYITVGQILENFFKIKGAAADPRYQYMRDPFYFQSQQMILQKAQMAMQQQMMAQQQMMQQAAMAQGQGDGQEGDNGDQEMSQSSDNQESPTEKTQAVNYSILEKTIRNNHDAITKQLLKRHREMVDAHMEKWKKESKRAMLDIEKALKKKG